MAWRPTVLAFCSPLLALSACSFTEHRVEEASDEVLLAMQEHHLAAQALRRAVIQGDLAAAQAAAAALDARLPLVRPARLPPPLLRLEQALERETKATATAGSLEAIAAGTGRIAAGCGDCHQAAGLSPEPGTTAWPPSTGEEAGTLRGGMAAHAAAEEQLWRGLMRPDLAEFRKASETLAQATILPAATGADSPLPQEVTDLEIAVHDLAAKAARSDDPAERARSYGELLATCGSCHRYLGKGPGAQVLVEPNPQP